jgi:hypothetical protein
MQYKFNSTNNVLLLGTLLVLGLAVIIWGAATKWKFIKSGNDAQKPKPGTAQLGDKCSQLLGAHVNETCASGLVCQSSNTDTGGVPVCMKPDNTPKLGPVDKPPVPPNSNTGNKTEAYTESYTIAPAALYQEGITNTSPSSCFTGADTAPPYTQDPNGSCQKNTAGSYGNSFGYDIYQNTVTYDPNSNLNYGYTDGAVESYAMVQHPMSGYLNQAQQNNHRGHQTAAFEQWKHKNTYMIEF